MGAICPRRHCLRQWRRNWGHMAPMSPSAIFSTVPILVSHVFPSESTKMRHPFHDRKIQNAASLDSPAPDLDSVPTFEIATDLRWQRGLLKAQPAHTAVRSPPETLGDALFLLPSTPLPSFPFLLLFPFCLPSISSLPASLPPPLLFASLTSGMKIYGAETKHG